MMSQSLEMAALHWFQLSTIQTSVSFLFSFNFDWVGSMLHDLTLYPIILPFDTFEISCI